jgi:hypothetical protein
MAERKTAQERRVERLTWALLFWVLAVTFALNLENWIATLGTGVVLLASAAYQRTRDWPVNPITWMAGFLLAVLGAAYPLGFLEANLLPLTLLVLGAVIVLGAVSGEV